MTEASVSGMRAAFAPLEVRDLRVFFAGQAVSLLGTWMQTTGLAWLVWELTHSAAALGTVAMFNFLPFLVLSPWAGTWVDRLDRRALLLRLQLVGILVAVALALVVQLGVVAVWQLFVSAAVLGVIATLEMAARPVFIGDLAGSGLLRRAIALNSSITQTSRVAGPALAGVLIGTAGVAAAFWVNAASFLAVIACLLAVRGTRPEPPTDGRRHGFGEAVTFLRKTTGLRELVVLSAVLTFFGISASTVFPAVADVVLGGQAATLGWLLSASGAGALVSAVAVVPMVSSVRRVGLLAPSATMWAGVWLGVFSASTWLPMSLAALFLSGVAFPVVITTTVGMLQLLGPKQMRARLQSALLMVTFGIQPLGALVIGWSAGHLGSPLALRVNALLMIVSATLLLLIDRSLRTWQSDVAAPVPATAPPALSPSMQPPNFPAQNTMHPEEKH